MADATNEGRKGWSWFEREEPANPTDSAADNMPDPGRALCIAYARCFASPDGEKVLDHLRSLTLERTLGPDASTQMLRHTEGQRQLVAYITAQTERGRQGG